MNFINLASNKWARGDQENYELNYRDYYATGRGCLSDEKQRMTGLSAAFEDKFHNKQYALFRAPGRVNLIGEHTDYNGYPVLPLAINRDVMAAVSQNESRTVTIANMDDRFGERSFELSGSIKPFATGDWGNYIKAAVVGLYPVVSEQKAHVRGFEATFSGTIPSAAGLSSSSALVVLAAQLFLWANDVEIPKIELAERLARAERFVGTEGGGMDQAASLMGEYGKALKIDFFPLRVNPVAMPKDYRVVVANSLVKAPKTAEAMNDYNRRPIECRLAAALIARELAEAGLPVDRANRLVDVRWRRLMSRIDYERLVARALEPGVFWQNDLLEKLDIDEPEFKDRFLALKSGGTLTPPADGFKVKQRYQHVVAEAERVEQTVACLEEGDIEGVGSLMNASHESCADLYEISTPELDALVEIARKNGAVGSRLTGAGFGGCIVSLVHKDIVDEFIAGVTAQYYQDYLPANRPDLTLEPEDYGNIIFSTPAVEGACRIVTEDTAKSSESTP